jgi:hypothetical protein
MGEVSASSPSVNGCKMLDHRLTKKETIRFSLPRALAKRGQALVIVLKCPTCIASNQINQRQGDYLALGFKVVRLRIAEHVAETGAAAGPYVPLGREIAITDPSAKDYLTSGWRAPEGGVARMARRTASMRMSILNSAGDPLLLTALGLAGIDHPGLRQCALRIDSGGGAIAVIDATLDREVSILLRRGLVAESGALELKFMADNLLAAPDGGDRRAIGPGLKSFAVERLPLPDARPVFIPGFVYGFADKGHGLQFRGAGWRNADAHGSVTRCRGQHRRNFVTRSRYAFVTAVVHPVISAPEGITQELTIAANGSPLATYQIAERGGRSPRLFPPT